MITTDRPYSKFIEDEHDRIAPAYAYREVHEQENDEAHGRMTIVAILLLFVFAGLARFWVWPGIRDGMTRAEMAQWEGR